MRDCDKNWYETLRNWHSWKFKFKLKTGRQTIGTAVRKKERLINHGSLSLDFTTEFSKIKVKDWNIYGTFDEQNSTLFHRYLIKLRHFISRRTKLFGIALLISTFILSLAFNKYSNRECMSQKWVSKDRNSAGFHRRRGLTDLKMEYLKHFETRGKYQNPILGMKQLYGRASNFYFFL